MSRLTAPEIVEKQPWEKVKYYMNFTAVLQSDESISTVNDVIAHSDLTISDIAISSDFKKVECFIEGGTSGKTYRIEFQVTTSLSQKFEGDGKLKVSDH